MRHASRGWLFARTLPNVGLLYGSDGAQRVKRVIKGNPSSRRHNSERFVLDC